MPSYLIKKDKKTNQIVAMEYELTGYQFHPKNAQFNVKEITIIDPGLTDTLLSVKFERAFHKLMSVALTHIADEDATSDDTRIILGEAEKLKEILLKRYAKYIKKEKQKLFLEKIRVLEKELNKKLVYLSMEENKLEMEEEKSHHRSR